MVSKPQQGEYNPYYETYIGLVPEGDLTAVLESQLEETIQLYSAAPKEKLDYRYAPGKWTMKDVLGHVLDTERIMAYRLLCVAYGEKKPLPGFDEQEYMANDPFSACTVEDLLEEYTLVRKATVSLLKRLPEQLLANQGNVNGAPTSARALAYVITGHERHHIAIVKERYL